MRGQTDSRNMVRGSRSASDFVFFLFCCFVVTWKLGWIEPHAVAAEPLSPRSGVPDDGSPPASPDILPRPNHEAVTHESCDPPSRRGLPLSLTASAAAPSARPELEGRARIETRVCPSSRMSSRESTLPPGHRVMRPQSLPAFRRWSRARSGARARSRSRSRTGIRGRSGRRIRVPPFIR